MGWGVRLWVKDVSIGSTLASVDRAGRPPWIGSSGMPVVN